MSNSLHYVYRIRVVLRSFFKIHFEGNPYAAIYEIPLMSVLAQMADTIFYIKEWKQGVFSG